MLALTKCPVCAEAAGTVVCEYNRFILLESAPSAEAARYDYALCHRCALLYATRRPNGPELRALVANFNESLGRADGGSNLVLNPHPLTEDDRRELARRAANGVFVSEHTDLGKQDWLPGLLRDRVAKAPHADLLGSLVDLRGKRVIEIRSRTGALPDMLRRWCGAEVFAMAMFESQLAITQDVYGIPVGGLIDFDDFEIPLDGQFDLIVCNHMFTHAADPAKFFAEVRRKLVPGGHLYLYSEPDDAGPFPRRKSLFVTMNPFHLQAFDRQTFARCLRAAGLEPSFTTHIDDNFACLAQLEPAVDFQPVSPKELEARIDHYRRWRDFSVLNLPKPVRSLFADEFEDVEERALATGLAERDDHGRVHLIKQKKKKSQATKHGA